MKSRTIFSIVVAALVCVAATTALAAEGIPSAKALNDMGLSALQVMSDSQALAIRGMGYQGGSHVKRPLAVAAGISWANVGDGGDDQDGGGYDAQSGDGGGDSGDAGAGSINVYLAIGKYEASGINGSEAGRTVTESHSVDYGDGIIKTETTIRSIRVFAGGASAAEAF